MSSLEPYAKGVIFQLALVYASSYVCLMDMVGHDARISIRAARGCLKVNETVRCLS